MWCVLYQVPMYTGSVLSFPLHAVDILVCPSTKTTVFSMSWHLVQTQLVGVWIRAVILGWPTQLLSACTQDCWRDFHRDTWGDLYTSSGAVLIAECWRQALESLPQECYRFHRAAANGSIHDVAGRISEWVVPTDRAQTVWREERGNRMESVGQHSLYEATIIHSTAHVLHVKCASLRLDWSC